MENTVDEFGNEIMSGADLRKAQIVKRHLIVRAKRYCNFDDVDITYCEAEYADQPPKEYWPEFCSGDICIDLQTGEITEGDGV